MCASTPGIGQALEDGQRIEEFRAQSIPVSVP